MSDDRVGGLGRPAMLCLIAIVMTQAGCVITSNIFPSDKRAVYHFEHTFSVEDNQFRRSMDTFGSHMVPGNRARLLKNGDEIFAAMTEAIRDARVSVNLESYLFKDDKAGTLFAEALMTAARRGVEVRVLLDATGGKAGKLHDAMKAAGVDVRTFRPIKLLKLHRFGKRSHRKILVVDGTLCYTGGLGIDDRWLGNARNPKEWRDTQVEVAGPVAAQMQAIFAENWTFTTGEILAGEKFYPAIPPAGDVPAQAIKASRGDSSSLSKMLYYVAIKSAAKSIHLQNAYFLPDSQVRDAFVQAAKRGVEVKIMVPGPHIDIPLVRYASRAKYGEMLQAGVKIYEYLPTMLHNKTLVVDGLFSTVGSINFDARSMGKNEEESLAFYDRPFAAKVEEMFAEDLTKCRELTFEAWKKRGLGHRLAETFSWLWEPLY